MRHRLFQLTGTYYLFTTTYYLLLLLLRLSTTITTTTTTTTTTTSTAGIYGQAMLLAWFWLVSFVALQVLPIYILYSWMIHDGIQLAMVAACLVCATSSRITLCGLTLSCYAYVRTLQFVTADCIADASSP